MATRPVRFEFSCDNEKLKYTHPIPRNLVRTDAQAAQKDPQFVQSFIAAISPIVKEHETACRAACSSQCQNCGTPAKTVLMTPMSWLHLVDDPFVSVFTNPVCGKGECETKTRQKIQGMMMKLSHVGAGDATKPQFYVAKALELLPCKICGKTEKTCRCGRCRVVGYCGKEHQTEHWPQHKSVCKKPVQ